MAKLQFSVVSTRWAAFLMALLCTMMALPSLEAIIKNMNTQETYSDLQAAIDDAGPGDTIQFSGTQVGNFVINKDLTLKGTGKGAILNGNQTGAAVSVGTISNIVAYLDSLIVENGLLDCGGGIVNQATLHLTNVTVRQNTATDCGGGIYNDGSVAHLFVADSVIEYNTAANTGGGIGNDGGALVITHSKILNNTAQDGSGGGIFNDDGISDIEITDTKFENNYALNGNGGAMFSTGSNIVLFGVEAKKNKGIDGGAFFFTGGTYYINDSEIEKNDAANFGGGLYLDGATTIIRSEVEHNNASTSGGGIFYVGEIGLEIIKSDIKHNNPNNITRGLVV